MTIFAGGWITLTSAVWRHMGMGEIFFSEIQQPRDFMDTANLDPTKNGIFTGIDPSVY